MLFPRASTFSLNVSNLVVKDSLSFRVAYTSLVATGNSCTAEGKLGQTWDLTSMACHDLNSFLRLHRPYMHQVNVLHGDTSMSLQLLVIEALDWSWLFRTSAPTTARPLDQIPTLQFA